MGNLLYCAGFCLKQKLGKLFKDERGEVNIVAIVVLIGIALVLALIFKDFILDLLEDLFETISGNAKDAVKKPE